MAYEKTAWTAGMEITSEKLNKLEAGVANEQIGPKGETGAQGAVGKDGKSVKALALTTDADGKVTAGTITFSDDTTAKVTVTQAAAE